MSMNNQEPRQYHLESITLRFEASDSLHRESCGHLHLFKKNNVKLISMTRYKRICACTPYEYELMHVTFHLQKQDTQEN